jgi:hypothetical protein
MATVSAYKTVSSSWGSAGPVQGSQGPDGFGGINLSETYTISSTVTPDPAAEIAAKKTFIAGLYPSRFPDGTGYLIRLGDEVGDWTTLTAGVHAWINAPVGTPTAVFRAYQVFNAGLGRTGHMIRVEFDDTTDLIRTVGGPVAGLSQVRLTTCNVIEEFDLSDIEGGYGQ